jgi:prefoldin subunit 5
MCIIPKKGVFMKAQIYWSQKINMALDTDVAMFDEDYLFDIPEDLAKEYEELAERNKKMQEALKKLYSEKNP